jgi:predicted nucleic-acid-binding Zn-ribbon protein
MLKLKQPVRLYCPKCGWERVITDPLEAMSVTETSYRLAREKRELTCPKCGRPILSEPCILYPGGWKTIKELITEEENPKNGNIIIWGIASLLIMMNILLKIKK